MKPHYKTLGVEETATKDEIRAAYRKLSKEFHPDKQNGDDLKQKELNAAYDILSDPLKRASYDKYGSDKEPIDIEKSAAQNIEQLFSSLIKMEFDQDQFFDLAIKSVKGVLAKVKGEKQDIEEMKRAKERKLDAIKLMLVKKVKPEMKILVKVILNEITTLENDIASITTERHEDEIAVCERVLEILTKEYPAERQEEFANNYNKFLEGRRNRGVFDRYKYYYTTTPTA